MSEISDEELAVQAGRGDRGAFHSLVVRHHERVVRYIRSLNILSDYEDIANEVWLKLIDHLPRFKSDNFRAWLLRIAHNEAMNYHRRPTVRKTQSLTEAVQDTLKARAEPASDPDALRKFKECMDGLPEEFRAVLELLVDEQSYKQMAERLQVPIGTVQSRISRGRIRLADCLGVHAK